MPKQECIRFIASKLVFTLINETTIGKLLYLLSLSLIIKVCLMIGSKCEKKAKKQRKSVMRQIIFHGSVHLAECEGFVSADGSKTFSINSNPKPCSVTVLCIKT
ncbi:hypothetical protein ILYODFUR_014363 [Ilyodon furcidens]|uniref:Uncharacterized protein n=1 Tax=Ilyodon furcidens TaxID=33524 RepID=A0ABV0TUJ9_9TELE